MTHEHFQEGPAEWAALYAAGALPHTEHSQFEAHLATGCADCAAELQQLAPVVSALSTAVEPATPDPRIRAALLRRIATEPRQAETLSPIGQQARQAVLSPGLNQGLVIQRAAEGTWEDTPVAGVQMRVLFSDPPNNRFTALVRMAPGTTYPGHLHNGPEECLVLQGDLHVGEHILRTGDYQYAPAGTTHGVQSTEAGCLLMITSSLRDVFLD
jgi:quercetin dioxygenase-like cupin family protein